MRSNLGPDIDLATRLFAALREQTFDGVGITREAYGPGEQTAHALVRAEAEALGLEVANDAAGNLYMTLPGRDRAAKRIVLGSHLDSVRQGGNYDGAAGVLAGLATVGGMRRAGFTPARDITVLAVRAEEAGSWFPTSYPGSHAALGRLPPEVLSVRRMDTGRTLEEHMRDLGFDPDAVRAGKGQLGPHNTAAYLELHIEQGPVLEAEDLPVGIVTAIAGAERHVVEIAGVAGHAGTVPMDLRHDALTAASEMILAAETLARETEDLVATIGQIAASPGAVNVIPSGVRFSLDIRSPRDSVRHDAVAHLFARWQDIAARRAVSLTSRKTFEESAAQCDPSLTAALDDAVARAGLPIRHLPSGAGHDGLAMAALCPIAMLFLRCRGGISHNPAESILADDAGQAAIILADAIRHLAAARVLSVSRGAA